MKKKPTKIAKKIVKEFRSTDSPLGSYSGNAEEGRPVQDADDL